MGKSTPIAMHLKKQYLLCTHKCQYLTRYLILSEVTVNDAGEEPVELKDLIVKIDDLNLSARSFNSLDRAGLKYLGELVLMSEVEVKNIKNLGKKSFDEIAREIRIFRIPN